jgi:hypothetical protein
MMYIEITIGHQMFHMINMLDRYAFSLFDKIAREELLLQGPGSARRGGLKEALRSTTTSKGISIVSHDGLAWGDAPRQKMMKLRDQSRPPLEGGRRKTSASGAQLLGQLLFC